MPDAIEVRKIPLHSVSDASELGKLIDDGVLDADRIVAVIGKTEGNGGVNDYTRIIADRAFREVIAAKGTRSADDVKSIPIVWSGGTDGVISPHATVFATVPADQAVPTDEPRLTVGFAMSEPLLPEEIGYTPMIDKVAAAVEGGDGAGRHHRSGRRALRADQDSAADHPHHPGREVPRQGRVDRAHPRVDGPVERVHGIGYRGRPRRDRDADRRRCDAQPVPVLLGRVLLVRGGAGPGAGGGGGQRPRRRRPLPDRPLGDARRPGRRRHLGGDRRCRAGSAGPAHGPPTSAAGW